MIFFSAVFNFSCRRCPFLSSGSDCTVHREDKRIKTTCNWIMCTTSYAFWPLDFDRLALRDLQSYFLDTNISKRRIKKTCVYFIYSFKNVSVRGFLLFCLVFRKALFLMLLLTTRIFIFQSLLSSIFFKGKREGLCLKKSESVAAKHISQGWVSFVW